MRWFFFYFPEGSRKEVSKRWKQFIIIPALMLVLITSVTPIKVVAQSFVELSLVLWVGSVGPGEAAVLVWVPELSQENPQMPRIDDGFIADFSLLLSNNTSDETCTQTILYPAVANAVLNTLTIARNEHSLLINGEEVEQLKDCLRDPNRIAVAVGRPFPPGLSEQDSDPNAIRGELENVRILSYSFLNASGATVASGEALERSFTIKIGEPTPTDVD